MLAEFAKKAVEADNKKEWQEAIDNYCFAVEYFYMMMKYDKNPTSRAAINQKVPGYKFTLLLHRHSTYSNTNRLTFLAVLRIHGASGVLKGCAQGSATR